MTDNRVASGLTAGNPVPLDAQCVRCRREGVFAVALYALTADGPLQVAERIFCVCETRPAERPTITNGDARRTGEQCDRCHRVSMYEVPFFAMTTSGIAPHSTRTICRECDTRPKGSRRAA